MSFFFFLQTIAICKKFTDLHADMTPKIVAAMKRAVANGAPVNTPVWWVDPGNEALHAVNDGNFTFILNLNGNVYG